MSVIYPAISEYCMDLPNFAKA